MDFGTFRGAIVRAAIRYCHRVLPLPLLFFFVGAREREKGEARFMPNLLGLVRRVFLRRGALLRWPRSRTLTVINGSRSGDALSVL